MASACDWLMVPASTSFFSSSVIHCGAVAAAAAGTADAATADAGIPVCAVCAVAAPGAYRAMPVAAPPSIEPATTAAVTVLRMRIFLILSGSGPHLRAAIEDHNAGGR